VIAKNQMCELCDGRLMYGFDYLGNTCGNKKGSVNLESYNVRYWQNPNQVYRSGVLSDPFNLADARSICLQDCPTPSTTNYLTWVCDYPQGPINLTMDDWAGRNYDYYDLLSPAQKSSSINLTGPCYPVLFQSTNCKTSLTSICFSLNFPCFLRDGIVMFQYFLQMA
jgi:choline transporter-like protein 2/4/5